MLFVAPNPNQSSKPKQHSRIYCQTSIWHNWIWAANGKKRQPTDTFSKHFTRNATSIAAHHIVNQNELANLDETTIKFINVTIDLFWMIFFFFSSSFFYLEQELVISDEFLFLSFLSFNWFKQDRELNNRATNQVNVFEKIIYYSQELGRYLCRNGWRTNYLLLIVSLLIYGVFFLFFFV